MSKPARRPGRALSLLLGLLLVAGALGLLSIRWGGSDEDPGGATAGTGRIATSPVEPHGPADLFQDISDTAGLATFAHHLPDGDLSNVIEALGAGGAVLDIDGDGRQDVYLVDGAALPGVSDADPDRAPPGNRLFRNTGNRVFEDVTGKAGVGDLGFGTAAVAADYDNDGDTDLYVINVGPNVLYRNRGDGTFEDVTARAAVGDAGTGVGAVFLDADGDGFLDLFVVNYLAFDPSYDYHYGPNAFPGPLAYAGEFCVLYRNRGDGTFEDVSDRAGVRIPGHRGMAVAAFDADRDGDQDLYVTNDATANLLLVNDGHGRFEDRALEAQVGYGQHGEATASMAAEIGDCDGDGLADIVVTDTAYGSLYIAKPDASYEDRVVPSGIAAIAGQYVSWGGNLFDYDNDGDLDLFIANGDMHHLLGWEDLLLENDGRAVFVDASSRGGSYFQQKLCGRASAVADLDDDGRLDLLVTNLADRPVLLRNATRTGNHWLVLDLEGTRCNRDGFGAVVTMQADDLTLVREARCPTGYLFQGDRRLHFGLGARDRVDRVTIVWPGGQTQVLVDVPVDGVLRVKQAEAGQ